MKTSEKWAIGFLIGCLAGLFLVSIVGSLVCHLQGGTCPAPVWVKAATFIFLVSVGIASGTINASRKERANG